MSARPTITTAVDELTESAVLHGKLVAMNEELMVRSMHQHELAEVALSANARLQKEVFERRKVEAALRESEKRYRNLFDLGPVAIYSCDSAGVIQKFNRRAAELWGRKPALGDTSERFCGSSKLFHPDGSFMAHERCPMADVLTGKRAAVHNVEVIVERPDGSRVIAMVDIRPLKDSRGEITGAINCFYDITEHKAAEEAQRRIAVLAATNQKLEREVAQRRAVEKALKTVQEQQRQLLTESSDMRDQLRLLSHQLLQAQEEERKRISRDLHDLIAQTLTSVHLRLAALKGGADMHPEENRRNITRTQQLVEKAVNIVHQFARELRPAVLDDIGLIPALHTYLKGFREDTGIQISLTAFAGVESLKADKRIVLFRIAQEALANVERHAKASRVGVSIQKQGGAFCLKITDNGKGLPAERVGRGRKNQRLGLLGMKERLEMVGGKFTIESAPGEGVTVTALIPIDKSLARTKSGGTEPMA